MEIMQIWLLVCLCGCSFLTNVSLWFLTVEDMLKDEAPDWHRVLEYVESIYRHLRCKTVNIPHPDHLYRDHECFHKSTTATVYSQRGAHNFKQP